MTRNEERRLLVAMLLSRGQAEHLPGYGHATGEDVADTVLEWLAIVEVLRSADGRGDAGGGVEAG